MIDEMPGHDEGPETSLPLEEIPEPMGTRGTAMNVQFGRPMPPQRQVFGYSSDEWEEFIHEWVHCMKTLYSSVQRVSGPNDMGIDIAGFTDEEYFEGVWDNFQCKHYKNPLSPAIAAVEIAKVLWHTFNSDYSPPRKYYFVAPQGCGTMLTMLLNSPEKLRDHIIRNWATQCSRRITSTQTIDLEDEFRSHVESFDYGIFSSRKPLDIIDDHRKTPFYAVRFGGGLPARPTVAPPPDEPAPVESRYIEQLFEAYSDHVKTDVADLAALGARTDLREHFQRQREFFYHAEALRNFARDTVPPGTFDELQDEVYAGVVDVESGTYPDGYSRLNAVTQVATGLQLTCNALISAIRIHDKKGICHQLANEDRLRWRKT